MMYDRIVIPVDGSDEAKRAARHGLELARVFEATVYPLHVVERNALRLTETVDEKTQLRERGADILDEIDALASGDQSVTPKLTEGKPAVQISEYAAEQDADLVVIGRQGMTGVRKRLLGGVTEQVLHQSDVPVFVVPDEDGAPETNVGYPDVLIPTDGSENADAAIPHGATIGPNFGASIHVLNVVDLQAAGGAFDAGGLEQEFIDRLERRGRAAVDRVADEIESSAPDVEIETAVERTSSHGGVAPRIHEYVRDTEIDLVIMGSHGRSNLKRQLLGSVASTVLRSVDVPVLVVKRTA